MSFVKLFGGGVCIIVAMGFLFVSVDSFRNGFRFHNAKYFPSVVGTIQSSEIVDDRPKWWSAEENPRTRYYVIVRYKFEVDGVSFESDKTQFEGSESYSSRDEAQAAVEKYPIGSKITVYYKPDNLKLSALKLGSFKERIGVGVFAGIVSSAVFALCLWLINTD